MICPHCSQDVGEAAWGSYFDPWNGDLAKTKPCPKCSQMVELVADEQVTKDGGDYSWAYWLEKPLSSQHNWRTTSGSD